MDEMGETACTDGEDEFPDEPTSPPVEEEADEGTSPSPAAEEEETTAGCDRPNYTICYPKERPWEPICMNCSTRVPLYLLSANYSDERPCPKCGGHLCFPPKFPKEWKLAPVVDAFHCGCGQYRDRIYSPQCDRCRTKLKPKMEEEESQPATDATDRGPAS